MMDELDRERVESLSLIMLEAIRGNYLKGPCSADRIYEALNALAFTVASTVIGTGSPDAVRQCRSFFDRALDQSLTQCLAMGFPGEMQFIT
jgi:hypothetical protein